MLTVPLHSCDSDVAAVVTRYYGGVKLGTGGLVKAYGGAVQQALATLPRAERIEIVELTVRFTFPMIDRECGGADVPSEKRGRTIFSPCFPSPRTRAAHSLRLLVVGPTRGDLVHLVRRDRTH